MTTAISASNGWWSFTNYAPLTTTYTPAPSCTSSDRLGLGYINHGYPVLDFAVQCTSSVEFQDCLPAATATASETDVLTAPNGHAWAGFGGFYSPGLYCPSGWETIGVAVRDASSTLTSSGILSTTPALTFSSSDPASYYYATLTRHDPATVLKNHLEPSQTMAVCCPSSFTANAYGACYSVVSDYKPTWGCQAYEGYNYEYGDVTETITRGTHTRTYVGETPTTTIYTTETKTHSFKHDETSVYSAISLVPMVTLLHHESDLASASLASASAARANGSAHATGTNAATSNAAVRLAGGRDGWSGIGPVFAVVMAAMGLGAAIVLQ